MLSGELIAEIGGQKPKKYTPLPGEYCVTTPGTSEWSEYRRLNDAPQTYPLRIQLKATIFLPSSVPNERLSIIGKYFLNNLLFHRGFFTFVSHS